jgi:type 1 fimbriae regulatory protein FimB
MNKRKHLTLNEINLMLDSAGCSRFALRDTCMIQMCFFHGLRVSELTHLTLSDIDMGGGNIFIRRLKKGLCTMQPLSSAEIVAIKQWLECRRSWPGADTAWFFLSRLGTPLSRQQVYVLLKKYGLSAGLAVSVHPHMLRHACGYALADNGVDTRLIQDYLGHKNIRHTVLYTAGNAERFNGIWERAGQKNLPFWPKLVTSLN